jgi:hypothetical protein
MVTTVRILAPLLVFLTMAPSTVGRHNGRVLLMGKWTLIFDDQRILLNAGMMAGEFFEQLERRKTTDGELFFMHSKQVSHYPKLVTVRLFGNAWELGDTVFDKRCSGNAADLMSSLQFKAEWKTGLGLRPVSKMTVRNLKKDEMMPYPSLWGYELEISSEGIRLTDHLIVSVYGPDSNIIVRFSGAP